MSNKYDVMITNPPYVGISSFEDPIKKYANQYYPNSKTDMFAMFMEVDLIKENGFLSMINMHNWMFIDSFSKLRDSLLQEKLFLSLVHFGIKAFELIGNDIVQTCSFIIKNTKLSKYLTTFIKLDDYKDYKLKEIEFYNDANKYILSTDFFLLIPSKSFSYWVERQFFINYDKAKNINDYGELTGSKNITGNNNKYLRFFWEISVNKIGSKWIPYSKGGFFRKYYGNIINVIDWSENARLFYKTNKTSNLLNENYWFKPGITYSAVTSRGTGFRYLPPGCIFDYGGPGINVEEQYIPEILALLNSKVADYYFTAINPSVNLQTKDIRTFLFYYQKTKI